MALDVRQALRSRVIGGVIAGAMTMDFVLQAASPAAAAEPMLHPKNAAEFDVMFEQIKDWGRWGAGDQLGALNLITDAKRRQALALAKTGRVVSVAHPLIKEPAPDNMPVLKHTVTLGGMLSDTFEITPHHLTTTHIDALCHATHKGQTYNGHKIADIATAAAGCRQLGMETFKNGIVTRGVLIDIPRLKGVPYLEPRTRITVSDVEAWEKMAGVKVSSGDALFLRTGKWARRADKGPVSFDAGAAGFDVSIVPWLKARGVAVLGSDAQLDVLPSGVEGVFVPVHEGAIVGLGITVLDNIDPEALSETAAGLKQWEFLMTVAPVVLPGGTGFPVNILAMF